MPRKDSFFNPVDHWSETLAEAEEHARFHAEPAPESDHDFEYPGDDIDEDIEYYERCGCDDPCCPCDGVKWGAYSPP